jgi:hypothetical protein
MLEPQATSKAATALNPRTAWMGLSMGCFSLFVGLFTRHSLSSALIEVEKFDFTNDDMPT